MVFGLIGEAISQSNQTDAATTEKLAEEAYIYVLPILMSYKTMYQYSIKKGPQPTVLNFPKIENIKRSEHVSRQSFIARAGPLTTVDLLRF